MKLELLLAKSPPLDACLALFATIKHTRLEGLIVEHEVEQTLLVQAAAHGWRVIDALVLRRWRTDGPFEFLVVGDPTQAGVAHLVARLRRTREPVRVLQLAGVDLVEVEDPQGRRPTTPPVFLRASVNAERADPAAVLQNRVLAAYWGFAVQAPELAARFTREIAIKDLFVTPASKALWDLDRFLVHDDGRLLFLETKHKFPFGRQPAFGMNVGERRNAELLARAGFLTYHVVLVKPYWDKARSSTYLFFDRRARESALWVVGDMAARGFFGATVSMAPAATALHGRRGVQYVTLPLGGFSVLGTNAEPARVLADRLFALIGGDSLAPLTTALLNQHRIT